MAETPPTTPKRPSLISRHSSNSTTNLSSSHLARPKHHLVGKRTKSSTQLGKLTKSHSVKNLTKAGLKPAVKFKRASSHARLNSIGRAENDGWVEESASTASIGPKATGSRPNIKRAITAPSMSRNGSQEEADEDEDIYGSPRPPSLPKALAKSPSHEQSNARLQTRNVSFMLDPISSQRGAEVARSSASSSPASPRHQQEEKERGSVQQPESQIPPTSKPSEPADIKPPRNLQYERIRAADALEMDSSTEDLVEPSGTNQAPEDTGPASDYLRPQHGSESDDESGYAGRDFVKRQKKYREDDAARGDDYTGANNSTILEDAPASTQIEDNAPREPTMSRTQFRLNLERQHTLNFREPRQRPTCLGWPDSVSSGDHRLLAAKPSVFRACREARLELESVRERGHNPFKDALEALSTEMSGIPTSNKAMGSTRQPAKRAIWATKRTATLQRERVQMPVWEAGAKAVVVDTFAMVMTRMWENHPQEQSMEE